MAYNLVELSDNLAALSKLQKQVAETKSLIYQKEELYDSLIDNFLLRSYPVYNPKSTYYEIVWGSKGFTVNVYYTLDNTWAGSKKFPYTSLEKFAEMENARGEIYESMKEWKSEEELQVLYEILREKFEKM